MLHHYLNPIEIGQTIGTLEIVSNDEIVFSTELVALQSIKSKGFLVGSGLSSSFGFLAYLE